MKKYMSEGAAKALIEQFAKKQWDESDLNDVVSNSEMYIENCMKYRYKLSTKQRVEQFLEVKK